MSRMLDGIAHVSFARGGMFIPARTPYDRQLLVEHIADRVRSEGRVQVLVDDRRWIVQVNPAEPARCAYCGSAVLVSCRSLSTSGAFCMKCALIPAQDADAVDATAESSGATAVPAYGMRGRVGMGRR